MDMGVKEKIEPMAGNVDVDVDFLDEDGLETPTEEEMETLRRVTGKVPWIAYTVAFVEFCERFSYYGTTAVCMLSSCPLD